MYKYEPFPSRKPISTPVVPILGITCNKQILQSAYNSYQGSHRLKGGNASQQGDFLGIYNI